MLILFFTGGSIAGLLLSNMGLVLFFPYSLMLMGMNSNSYEDKISEDTWKCFLSVSLYFLLFLTVSIRLLKTRNAKASSPCCKPC